MENPRESRWTLFVDIFRVVESPEMEVSFDPDLLSGPHALEFLHC